MSDKELLEQFFGVISSKINCDISDSSIVKVPIVLFGGAALHMHGARENFSDIDLYIPEKVLSNTGIDEIGMKSIDLPSGAVDVDITSNESLYLDYVTPKIVEKSTEIKSSVLEGAYNDVEYSLRLMDIEGIMLQKMYMPRDKDLLDVQSILDMTDPEKIIDRLNTLADSNSEGFMVGFSSNVLSEIGVHYFLSDPSSYEDSIKKLVDQLNLPKDSIKEIAKSFGLDIDTSTFDFGVMPEDVFPLLYEEQGMSQLIKDDESNYSDKKADEDNNPDSDYDFEM